MNSNIYTNIDDYPNKHIDSNIIEHERTVKSSAHKYRQRLPRNDAIEEE